MDKHAQLKAFIQQHPERVGKVVDFDPASDKLYQLDFSSNNHELTLTTIAVTEEFCEWVNEKLHIHNCRYGVGGYLENRTVYDLSPLFNKGEEPRRLHLGVDIWSDAGTPIYAPLAGKVHSFKDNNNYGDYGPTIILEHDLDGLTLYSLYGHLNRKCLVGLYPGKSIALGEEIALFGAPTVNGRWPPHLHFQLMFDMQGKSGDYPGVCRFSEMEQYRSNIPDPEIILQFKHATIS